MICPTCGAANPRPARFCQQCGSAFGPPCDRCGAVTWPEARFCTECGAPVAAGVGVGVLGYEAGVGLPAAFPANGGTRPPVLAGGAATPLGVLPEERRLVTVLFADVVGFTPLSERLDPEDVRDLMLALFRGCAEIVRRHGGRIEKYIGDALVGLFGAPVAREDDAERALHCALHLHQAIEAFSAERGLPADAPLRLRVGVNTGLAVVGTVADGNEYGVMGDTVNTAARLQTAAEPGATLVGEGTWRAAQRHFAFSHPLLLQLKGKAAPVLGYTLLDERARVSGAAEFGPLFGREREVEALAAWVDAVAAGQGRLGLILGETGIGKTRLLAEVRAHAERRGLRWIAAFGHPHRQHVPGGTFDEASRGILELPYLRADQGLPPEALEARLRARLAELGAESAYPFVAGRLGLAVDPAVWAELNTLPPAAAQARVATAIERIYSGLA